MKAEAGGQVGGQEVMHYLMRNEDCQVLWKAVEERGHYVAVCVRVLVWCQQATTRLKAIEYMSLLRLHPSYLSRIIMEVIKIRARYTYIQRCPPGIGLIFLARLVYAYHSGALCLARHNIYPYILWLVGGCTPSL